jgi:hypothetical protein
VEFLHLGIKENTMVILRERAQFPISHNWRVRAYPAGTVELRPEEHRRDPGGSWAFDGQLIVPRTRPAKEVTGKNLIVTVGKQLVGDMMMDETGYDTGLTYHAIGSNATAPVVGDTTLNTEEARKAVTAKSRLVNVVTWTTFFTAGESTYSILESGIFGHSTASAAADSGILFSRYLVTFDNSGGTYDLTFEYILTIG